MFHHMSVATSRNHAATESSADAGLFKTRCGIIVNVTPDATLLQLDDYRECPHGTQSTISGSPIHISPCHAATRTEV